MSADNWTICPRCYERAQKEKVRRTQRANESYGKVPQEEYLGLVEDAQLPLNLRSTLREDYEIGISKEGVFEVKYSASCQACSFRYKFNDSRSAYSLNSLIWS